MTTKGKPSRILFLQGVKEPTLLAESCLALTPKVSVVDRDLYLDIAPTLKFFGSEERVLAELESLLIALRLRPQIVLTDRMEWAKALCLRERNLFSSGDSQPFIPSLSIDSLQWFGDPLKLVSERKDRLELIAFLKRVGIFYLRDFLKLPVTALNRRFGALAVSLRDSVLGLKEVYLPFFLPEARIEKTLNTDSLQSLDAVLFEIRQSLVEIEARLWGRAELIKTLQFTFRLESGRQVEERLQLSDPTRDPNKILRLLREILNRAEWDSALQALHVLVWERAPYLPGQLSLWDDKEVRFQQMGEYLSRLRARLGEENVGFAALQEDFLPERSWKCIWPPKPENGHYPILERPAFLFHPPRPFALSPEWKLELQEKIQLDSWNQSLCRKYFIATHPQGKRLWVFEEGDAGHFFCHGTD